MSAFSQNVTDNQRIVKWSDYAARAIKEGRLIGQEIVIRKSGNLLELSIDGEHPLPSDIRNVIEPQLSYTYKKMLRGPDRRDWRTGLNKGGFEFELRNMYRYDHNQRMCCGIGFLSRIKQLLADLGVKARLIDCNPAPTNPTRYKEDWNLVTNQFEFRAKQDECLIQIASNDFGIVKAPTGFGKGSMISMVCLLYPKAKIHVVTPSKELVLKTVSNLTKILPNIGQVGCGKKQLGQRVTVISADSLHLSNADSDILIADEIHQLAASTYSSELARYRCSRNYGFSASPSGRMDGADIELESLFGPLIFDLSYQQAVKDGLVVQIDVDWLNLHMDHNPCAGKADVAKKRWGIWRNDARNQIIAQKALSYSSDQVLILVESIEHLMYLRRYLPGFSACYSEAGLKPKDVAHYRRIGLMPDYESAITTNDRRALREGFETGLIRKAIATGVWATGVDFVHLGVLIRADALASEIMDVQAPGRVSRICADDSKQTGILVDCLDQFDPSFHRRALGRKKTYSRNGWNQIITK